MRSERPFFEDELTGEIITTTAEAEGRLLLYCGAGVTIDRTGHSWGGLVMSLLPERRHRSRPGMPTRAQVGCLNQSAPDTLASSVVYLLREASGGGEKLQRALRNRLRRALYKTQGRWQEGALVMQTMLLAIIRSDLNFDTTFLTTNYDTYLEDEYEKLSNVFSASERMPGLRVRLAGEDAPVRVVPPRNIGDDAPGAYIDLVYLHGRLPPAGSFGNANWPLVLDENSYASTAPKVEAEIRKNLLEASLALMLGTSLRDIPLIRALSGTPHEHCQRIAVLLRHDFAHDRSEDEELALMLARHRAAELRVTPIFPDFPGQVAQLISEAISHLAYPYFQPEDARTYPYSRRVDAWWNTWSEAHADDFDLTDRLREILVDVLKITEMEQATSLMDASGERLQVELWVREAPVAKKRSLRRWARATETRPEGLAGKAEGLERNSYLAPVRAFTEGRPLLLDVESLDKGRHDITQYTWKSFLCVPIREHNAIVAVICLASDRHVDVCAMNRDEEMTENLVARLGAEGSRLVSV